MTEVKDVAHTPGPWTVQTPGADALVQCPDGRTFKIGDLIYHKENIANARLVAAAPELLAALERVRRHFNLHHASPLQHYGPCCFWDDQSAGACDCPMSDIAKALDAAIAKAEGRS